MIAITSNCRCVPKVSSSWMKVHADTTSATTCDCCCEYEYDDSWVVVFDAAPREPKEDNSEPYEPFPVIERDWLIEKPWLYHERPQGHRAKPQAFRRILTKPRRKFHLSAVERTMKQLRAKHDRQHGS